MSTPPLRNDDCITATGLTVGQSCNPTVSHNYGANISATPSYLFSCGDGQIKSDVWFVLRIPNSGRVAIETFQTAENGLSGTLLEAFIGSCDNLTSIACNNSKSYYPSYDDHARIELYNQPVGELLYIRVAATGRVLEGNFSICAIELEQQPSSCAINKIELQDQHACDPLTNTYSQDLIIHYTTTDTNGIMMVNDEAFALTENPLKITLNDLPSNNQWVDVVANIVSDNDESCWQKSFHFVKNSFQAAENCIIYGPPNDECEGAIFIAAHKDLVIDTFDNVGATWSKTASEQYACGNSGDKPEDVWFKTIVPLTGGIDISLPLFYNENNMILEVYKGSCGNLTLLDCDQFGQLWGSSVRITDQHAEDTLYIRVADHGSNTQDIFGIAILEYTAATTEEVSFSRSYEHDLTLNQPLTIELSPNPSFDHFVIKPSDNQELISYAVYDLNGRLMTKQTSQSTISVNTTTWPDGIYVLHAVNQKAEKQTKKLVVAH
jgi:hypothetical protein